MGAYNTPLRETPSRCRKYGRTMAKIAAVPLLLLAVGAYLAMPVPIGGGRLCANESNAIAALKTYAVAQQTYWKADYAVPNGLAARQYAPALRDLHAHKNAEGGPIALISKVFAGADVATLGPRAKAYQGFLFFTVHFRGGKPIDPAVEMPPLCAVPAVYDTTGINTYVIDQSGTVLMKDNGGRPVSDMTQTTDGTWFVP